MILGGVFDPLALFLPARDENNAGVMVDAVAPFLALAEADLAVCLLHHPSKGEPALGQAARGSGVLMASVEIFLEMRHPGGNPFTRRRKLSCWSYHEETPQQMLIELSPDRNSYLRLADASDDFHNHWDTVRLVLSAATTPLTRQELRAAWPAQTAKRYALALARPRRRTGPGYRTGKGTKMTPYRYGLAAG